MPEPQTTPRASCLSLALLMTVGTAVAAALVLGYLGPRAGTWTAIATAALTAVAVFMIERRLKGLFWGLLAALTLSMHPLVRQPSHDQVEWLAQGGVLAGLAAVAVGWRLAFHRILVWRLWPLVAVALAAAVGLTWSADPALGLVAALLCGATLLPAAVLARWQRLRADVESPPARLNVLTALAVALLAPWAGIYLSQFLTLSAAPAPWNSLSDAWQAYLNQPANGLTLAQVNRWCWLTAWLALPLLAWGWWRSCRRGWRDWRAGQPPTSWFLSVLVPLAAFTLVPRPELAPLTLLGITVIVLVFWLADVWKGALEQLILLPPEAERQPILVRRSAAVPEESAPASS